MKMIMTSGNEKNNMKTINELRELTRKTVFALDKSGVEGIEEVVAEVRSALAGRGQEPGCHVGNGQMSEDEKVEWYAGQMLSIVDNQAWFAMNAYINSVDRFCSGEMSEV